MPSPDALRRSLHEIDGRGYKAYKRIAGSYRFDGGTLYIDHVQGDPFAAPSKMRWRVPQAVAQIPPDLFRNRVRRIAIEDFLARELRRQIPRSPRRGTGKSGVIEIDAGGQEVLERTACAVTPDWVEARIEVGLPADGRRILGREAEAILLDTLPRIVRRSLKWVSLDADRARFFVDTVENQEHIRSLLSNRKLVAFVAGGAVLPRESGVSERPMKNAVPFRSPESLRVRMPLLNPDPEGATEISGMGVPEGVSLIVGGGYHGKTTLLRAIERGVYPHIPGDGREYAVTRADAVKIRAEDGRRIANVDISGFIKRLPFGQSTETFSSDDASGSTSQAANIIEALEVGAQVLLLDEDTSATNFMVRDARMQELVAAECEPILPFVDRVRELFESLGVSTVLVMGGSGDYFDPADTVLRMSEYLPDEVTAEAKAIAASHPTGRTPESESPFGFEDRRRPLAGSIDPSRGRRAVKIEARGRDGLVFGRDVIDLRAVEQLVDPSQTRAIGYALALVAERDEGWTLTEMLDYLDVAFDAEGLEILAPHGRPGEHPGNFARPRRFEIACSLNRLRSVRMTRS